MIKLDIYCADELEVSIGVDMNLSDTIRTHELINQFAIPSVDKGLSIAKLKGVILGMVDLPECAEQFIANALIKLKNNNHAEYIQALNSDNLVVSKSLFCLSKSDDELPLLGYEDLELEIDHVAIHGNQPDWYQMSRDVIDYYRTGNYPKAIFPEDIRTKALLNGDYVIKVAFDDFEFQSCKSDIVRLMRNGFESFIDELDQNLSDTNKFEMYADIVNTSNKNLVHAGLNLALGKGVSQDDYGCLLLFTEVKRRELGHEDKSCVYLKLVRTEDSINLLVKF